MSEDAASRELDGGPRGRSVGLLAVALFLIALIPRTVNLGNLSFYGDEDISVLTATAVAAGDGSVLPSGMAYRRALPFTWLNALSVAVLGESSELALRLPAAVLGALTVPALFLMGVRWIGFGGGLTAALLLAFSEWHLVFSRESRMYSAFLLFVVLATWALWTWVRTGRRRALVAGLATSVVAALLHRLAILLAGAPLAWLAFPGAVVVSIPSVFVVAALIATAGWAINDLWAVAPYNRLPMPPPIHDASAAASVPATPAVMDPLGIVLGGVGLLLAIVILRRIGSPADPERGARLRRGAWAGFGALTGVAAGIGQVYLFAVAGALFLLLDARGARRMVSRAWLPLLGLLGLIVLRVGLRVADVGVVEAIKMSARLPYPYAHTLVMQAPVPTILFGLVSLSLILFPYGESRRPLAVASLLVFGTLLAMGFVRDAGPTRYLISVYPLMLLVAGEGLYQGIEWIARRALPGRRRAWSPGIATAVASALVLVGALAGHGIPAAVQVARLEHGDPVNELTHMFPFRPDHRSVGRYVRMNRAPGDIVIAEDPLIQVWYAGAIDYWFRRYGDMRAYLRVHADGGIHDIYAGSAPITDPGALDSIAAAAPGRAWFITSGETAPLLSYYLSEEQRDWLDSLRRARTPLFVGGDGVSAVYCLNCDGREGAEGTAKD